jgi:hypothetical protein
MQLIVLEGEGSGTAAHVCADTGTATQEGLATAAGKSYVKHKCRRVLAAIPFK